ncbi:MAG: hypothetical protein MZV70_29875 [Desulfobacterales bacterium]|nr:hypothetical protein [Desulfobacterales bacterium]
MNTVSENKIAVWAITPNGAALACQDRGRRSRRPRCCGARRSAGLPEPPSALTP